MNRSRVVSRNWWVGNLCLLAILATGGWLVACDTGPGAPGTTELASSSAALSTMADKSDTGVKAEGANVLFVSNYVSDTNIITVLQTDGHQVDTYFDEASAGFVHLLDDLSGYDVVVWQGMWTGAPPEIFANLTDYVSNGGFVFYTGYDSTFGQGTAPFLGAGSSYDAIGNSLGPISPDATSLTVGLVDIRGLVPEGGYGDRDALVDLGADTVEICQDGGGGASWSLRTLGMGQIAWVANGGYPQDSIQPSWENTSSDGYGAYNGALRNFVWNSKETENRDSWRQVVPAQQTKDPDAGARSGHAMAYSLSLPGVVLFGGNMGGAPQQDTWWFDGLDWWPLAGTPVFPARYDAAMAADLGGLIVLYGGHDVAAPLADTWLLVGNNWTQIPAGGPGARTSHAMAYYESQNVWVLYGGFASGLDWHTWVFNLGTMTWTDVTNTTFPSPRQNHAMAYDAATDAIVMFGGYDGTSVVSGTWSLHFDGASWVWTHLAPATVPAAREGHAMAFDAVRGKVVMFGGVDDSGYTLDDEENTWEWDGLDWNPVLPYDYPGARFEHAMAFDLNRGVTVMYGGMDDGGSELDDTWEYPYLIDGESCTLDSECYSDNCIDGVCCNTRCGEGDLTDCQACSVANGSAVDGECLVIEAGLNHECRASITGDLTCDPPEFCDGNNDVCPDEAKAPEFTACGDPSDTDCDNPDTCDGLGACLVNHEPETLICRTDAGECDVAEYCLADGTCPTDDFEPPGTTCGELATECSQQDTCDGNGTCLVNDQPPGFACGDPADTVCDNPDTCDGGGTCLVNHEPETLICRTDAGDCDVPEYCLTDGTCPADGFEPADTACGDGTTYDCNDPDTCDNAGHCQDHLVPAGTKECRAAIPGDCDVAEFCDGMNNDCPIDIIVALGTTCGDGPTECSLQDTCSNDGHCLVNDRPVGFACGDPSDTVCDNPDTCDGGGTCLVNHEPETLICRDDAGDCDVPDYCLADGTCPADAFESAGTLCGDDTDDTCTDPDTCDGNGLCLPNNAPNDTVCIPDAGECDVADTCNNGVCPADSFEPLGTSCGDAGDTDCDNPDTCDGNGACQVNHEPTTVVCIPDAGDCDVADYCLADGTCPADSFESEGHACGNPADSVCDNPDSCNASGVCLANHEPTTTICIPDAGECDVADYCLADGTCPTNSFEPVGTACGSPTDDTCTDPDSCDGGGSCLAHNAANGTICRADTGECDVVETCLNGLCPAEGFEPAGTPCGDPNDTACNNPDTCDGANHCMDNFEPGTTICRPAASECDRDEYCTVGTGTCPLDIVEVVGTPCGDPSDTTCTDPDSCDGAGNCRPLNAADGTTCGDPTNNDCTDPDTCLAGLCAPNDAVVGTACGDQGMPCRIDDACDGSGTCVDNGHIADGTPCGDPSNSVCDHPDQCLAGDCDPNYGSLGDPCGDQGVTCREDDHCDGMGACADMGFSPASTPCGDLSDTECTDPDSCDGAGTCLLNNASNGTACGDSADTDCTNPDSCAAGTCMPNDAPSGTACGDQGVPCRNNDACNASGTCVDNGFIADGTPCGNAGNSACDHPDQCLSGACDPNYGNLGDPCGDQGVPCLEDDECNGLGSCTNMGYSPALTSCGDSSDTACTDPDSCDGGGNCLPRHEPNGTVCGPVPDPVLFPCDLQDTCNASGGCVDHIEVSGHVCRVAQHPVCDPVETCDGSAKTCPADVWAGAGTACGDTADHPPCDLGDSCSSGLCAVNHLPTTTVCRPAVDVCDVAENCTSTGVCANNLFATSGTSCDDADTCTMDDACNGTGTCLGDPLDADGDTFIAVSSPSGTACGGNDCNDGDAAINPGIFEGPAGDAKCADGVDNNCNTLVDLQEATCGDCNVDADCSDNDVCNGIETCVANACVPGTALDCNDGNVCTTDSCDALAGCANVNNTIACNDGDACTTNDTCAAGACVGGAPPVCNDDNVCTTDTCDSATGCVFTNNTAACDDDDACTTNDTCAAGACVGGVAPDCDDDNVCTNDSCVPATGCVHTDNTAACDDADACTTGDTCAAGVCVGGEPPDCNDTNPCTDDSCDSATGCVNTDNTAACDDGDACTTNDTCAAGACVGGTAPDCDDANVCTTDSCDSAIGCVNANNTLACDDGDACTVGDVCAAGACVSGAAPDCDDSNPCTDDSCDAATGCVNANNTIACDDGDACTVDDTCADGLCVSGTAPDCDDDNVCTTDSCDSATGCVNTDNTLACDDGDACTNGDLCVDGACVSGAALDCDDSNPCTDDSCDTATGCVNTDNTLACDDGDACTVGDICAAGACISGAAADCDDANVCTTDSCDTALGCQYVYNTLECEDGDACTAGDLCADGACVSGAAVVCDDSNPCTDDSCDTASGCVFTNNISSCEDGDACTVGDVCAEGACVAGLAADCDDDNLCTDDSCDAVDGCVNIDNTVACDDGSACTSGDTCSEGVCVSGAVIDCDDDNLCTDDTCDPATGCVHINNSVTCDDGDNCTTGDACSDGVCAGTQDTCDDGNPCTDDTCDAFAGCQHTNNDAAICDDGEECTIDDHCLEGVCVGTDTCEDTNGGGCGCATGNSDASSAIPLLLLGLFGLIRRRRSA